MEFFIQSPDLNEHDLSQLGQAALDISRDAVRQHKEVVQGAIVLLEHILREIGPALVEQTGNPWGVLQQRLKVTDPPGVLICDRVFIGEQVDKDGIFPSDIFIDVMTRGLDKAPGEIPSETKTEKLAEQQIQPGNWWVGYETSATAEFDPDEDDDPGIDVVRGDVLPPRICGTSV